MKRTTAAIAAAVVGMMTYNAYSAGKMKETPKGEMKSEMKSEMESKKDAMMMVEWTPETITWKSAAGGPLPAGVEISVLEGDPSKEGYFAMRAKLPAGVKIAPHWHSGHERLTVLQGNFALGMGEKWDDKALKEYKTGSYASMPPNMKHFAMAKEETVIQLATMGPWTLTYVDPMDDPRNQKKN